MFVIDGLSNRIVTDITYHELDVDFILITRRIHDVVGITVITIEYNTVEVLVPRNT